MYGRKGTIWGIVFLKDTEDISTETLNVTALPQKSYSHCRFPQVDGLLDLMVTEVMPVL